MNERKVQPKEYYWLASGQAVRVNSIQSSQVLCDIFDEYSKTWVQLQAPVPVWMLTAQCPNPSENVVG